MLALNDPDPVICVDTADVADVIVRSADPLGFEAVAAHQIPHRELALELAVMQGSALTSR
ncbi:hypothetical protein QR97_18505 [Streptomyces sp. PBH53]|uniref:hypothetical protein n=1 Tax=Streptomyces tricolor TaxID=68277 RepID=UPI000655DE7C|nr:hypothetical protein [Streptomyces sp. PBH53]AKN71531.1 hypothetical protein QR97_18505 [Streptomyces sp. PBH53]